MARLAVCKQGEMKDGDVRIVEADKLQIGVFRHAGSYHAYSNHCLHQGGPACEGIIRGRVMDILGKDKTFQGQTYDEKDPHFVCPWHGWEYRLLTGECAADRNLRLRRFNIEEDDGVVYVVV